MRGKLLITGGSGLLALNWAAAYRARQSVTLALHRRRIALPGVASYVTPLDTRADAIAMIEAVRPDAVVNAAGLTNVEACEADPSAARHVNVEIARHIAEVCDARGIALVHVSTDQLFAGHAPMVTETTPVAPMNTYARTKAEAERVVMAAHPGALIARTNFYGWGTRYRQSFSDRIIDALRGNEPITLFSDVFFTPVLASDVARAALELLDAGASGVKHVSGDERLSKHAFGLKLARRFGLDVSLIRDGLLREAPGGLAPRPLDMSLSNEAARAILGRPLGNIDAQLAQLHEQEQSGLAEELKRL